MRLFRRRSRSVGAIKSGRLAAAFSTLHLLHRRGGLLPLGVVVVVGEVVVLGGVAIVGNVPAGGHGVTDAPRLVCAVVLPIVVDPIVLALGELDVVPEPAWLLLGFA